MRTMGQLKDRLESWFNTEEGCDLVMDEIIGDVELLEQQKDGAYGERDQLVAALSKLFPASLERHPDEDKTWEDDWRWIVFIDLPTGQATWHIHDSELPFFDHLPRKTGRTWDGHSTPEKYGRLNALDLLYTSSSQVVELRNVTEQNRS